MDSLDDRFKFEGKPAKSASVIRSLLTSIHDANEPRPARLVSVGRPNRELVVVKRAAKPRLVQPGVDARWNYRAVLLDNSILIGAVAGGFLGANLGCSIAIATGVAKIVADRSAIRTLVRGANHDLRPQKITAKTVAACLYPYLD